MNPIVLGIGKKALDLFYKKFGRRIIKTAADSKWMANTIRLLKQKAHKPKTSDVAQKVREKMLKDKPFEGFTPKIVPKTKIVPKKPNPLGDILQGKPYIDKQGRSWGFEKVPTPKGLKKSNVIPFPKKPPGKAEGGLAGMLGEPRSGYRGGGGPTWSPGGSEFPILLNPFRPGGQKPGLSDYDDDVWDFDYIELPMGGAMKKMKKKKGKGKGKKDKAEGGKIGFNGGGYVDYWTMVQESFSNAGGQDATGMNIQDFAEMYFPRPGQAEGGRIGLADGDTPSQAWMRDYFYDAGYDDEGVITLDDYMRGPKGLGWKDYKEHGPGKAKGGRIGYDNGGPVDDDGPPATKDSFAMNIFSKPYDELTKIQQIEIDGFFSFVPEKAEGGRIGFKDGEGIMSRTGDMVDMRNVPYYAGEGLKGLVNSAETLSKFPLAAGELGSKLLREKPNKEMFSEALENITPGSWSENLGLTSLVEGMREKRPDDAKTVGGILGLGTEVAVPTGGAFKAGQLLLSKASKAMGKVKDGKTLEKLVDEKLTDSGQSRRDFNLMAITSGIVAALTKFGMGGLLKTTTKLKPPDDVVMTLKTFIDDGDVMTDAGPVATGKFGGLLDVEGLTKAAQKTLVGIMKDVKAFRNKATGKKNLVDSYEEIDLDWGSYIADALKKAGHKVRLEHVDDVGGSGVDEILWRFKNDPMYKGTKEGAEHYKKFSEKVKKMTEREKFEYHNSLTDDYHNHYSGDVEDLLDVLMPVKKAEGGRIGLAGGTDFQRWLEGKQKFDIEQNREELYKEYLEDKRRQKVQEQKHMAADGGRIGLQTGGPPITLQRPMFNDGGLTKTIPPERGPDPQGLPSALYNGIMRPRSY